MRRACVLLGFALHALSGCATTSGESSAWSAPRAGEPRIAGVWRARCGQCHRRVEPGTRTREHLEDALSRHRKRARLSEAEWHELIDFLAAPPASVPAAAPAQPGVVSVTRPEA